ncbi:glycosyltransferase [Acinetobacter bouvetii]|uniref:Chondroitin synthase n=1 Tax=Acinetobacter bouvetii TaxID=202951 RepID=A0A811G5V7_9GAMM|nr:glycosyltransferase [Acinetobacter bouvetii]CAB1208095.1 Chondroitin synthase [Acinetobacter bouvetii]
MSEPLISIALATYNGEKFIAQQMDSLLLQDYPNLEIVISDDCSQDGTWEILQKYAQKDSRIRLLPRDTNIGYVKNFIRVFRACKGELISPCDQDDIWYPEKTRRLADIMGDAALVYCDSRFVDQQSQPLGIKLSDTVHMITGRDSRQVVFCTSICGHAMLFRKQLLDLTDKLDAAPYIDWIIAYLAAEYGHISYLDEVLVDWRQHRDSTTFHVRGNITGAKEKILATDRQILEVFSSIPSKHQDFVIMAKQAWDLWFTSYFSFSMFIFVLRYGKITHRSHPAKFPSLKYVFGYKLKKLLRSNYY